MEKLIATFEFELPFFLLINVPAEDKLEYMTKIGDFTINSTLIRDEDWRIQIKGDRDWSQGVTKIIVTVIKDENTLPPPIKITPEGHKSYEDRRPYFDERISEYQKVALDDVNRIIRYFKYALHNPIIYELSNSARGLLNPVWADETGEEIKSGTVHMTLSPIPGMGRYKLGATRLTPTNYKDLQKAIDGTLGLELYEDLLSDAQAAFFQQNFRRAILEMAIATELFLKTFYFGRDYISNTAFDYLEDKGRVNTRVTELIDPVAKRAFGKSFKEDHPSSFYNIDYLFRARNKIAHRAEISYRDDSGNLNIVTENTIEEWWNTIQELIDWIKINDIPVR